MKTDKTTKINNPSIKENKITKKQNVPLKKRKREEFEVSPWLEDYLDCFQGKYKPVTQAFLERIGQEMVIWAKTEERAYKIAPFFDNKHIGFQTYTSWAKKYPNFGAAYNLAKSIIGTRREYGSLERKLDSGTVLYNMHAYDPEWKEAREYHSSLRQIETKNQNSDVNVYMNKFPSSDRVPEKPSKKEVAPKKQTPEEVAYQASMKSKNFTRLIK